ncbi:MAG: hypothetical protein HY698_20395 [Deltaproteobacteria bacterium]|nr:hypothetical protein [Deltaproteobacteria bacterium]
MSDRHEDLLAHAQRAYEVGDFAGVRALVHVLLAEPVNPSVRKEAELLIGRIEPDRAVLFLTVGCFAFLVSVVLAYLT